MVGSTEIRVAFEPSRTPLEKYINSRVAGGINLKIKEEWLMYEFSIDALREKRAKYVAELERLKTIDVEKIKNARFELVKEKIAEEVQAELDLKIEKAELDILHYDVVITDIEAELEAKINEEEINMEE